MGNSASSGRGHHEETVDFGYLTPQGVYTGPRDWNHAIVSQLIVERKLAPFYRPLEDYDESWDDEQILAARKEPPEQDASHGESSIHRAESNASSLSSRTHHKRPSTTKEPSRYPEAAIYRGAVECPICFLYYPANINYSRCCGQAICTECFVQIKRADPTTTHLVSEPASCPYCVQPNFGVVYTPPPWRTGIGSEGATPPSWPDSPRAQSLMENRTATTKQRRKSFSPDSPDVVTTDHIRPDWEAKLAAVKAAVTRRANRRIIMRQVGDRLIPVGVTSGRVHALPTGEDGQVDADGEGSNGDRGSRRRRAPRNGNINQLLGSMGIGGQDLEELMVMEAMRLSLLEHEEQQRRQREEEAKRLAEAGVSSPETEPAASPSTTADTQPSSASTAISPVSSEAPSGSRTPVSADVESASRASRDHLNLNSNDTTRQSTDRLSPSSISAREGKRRSSGSSFSITAGLQAAASTAAAVGSPTEEADLPRLSTAGAGTSQGSSSDGKETVSPSRSLTPAGTDSTVPLANMDDAGGESSADAQPSDSDAVANPPPLAHQPISFASADSSAASASYDILPSSAASVASSMSQKPLLQTDPIERADSSPAPNGDSTTAA